MTLGPTGWVGAALGLTGLQPLCDLLVQAQAAGVPDALVGHLQHHTMPKCERRPGLRSAGGAGCFTRGAPPGFPPGVLVRRVKWG